MPRLCELSLAQNSLYVVLEFYSLNLIESQYQKKPYEICIRGKLWLKGLTITHRFTPHMKSQVPKLFEHLIVKNTLRPLCNWNASSFLTGDHSFLPWLPGSTALSRIVSPSNCVHLHWLPQPFPGPSHCVFPLFVVACYVLPQIHFYKAITSSRRMSICCKGHPLCPMDTEPSR